MRQAIHCLLLLLTTASAAAAADADSDPLRSPACLKAMHALQQQQATLGRPPAPASSKPAGDNEHNNGQHNGQDSAQQRQRAALEPLRQAAARSCLGSKLDPAPAGRLAQPPLPAGPLGAAPPALAPARPITSTAPPPAVQIPMPRSVTSCDAVGCWANDGTRLPRVGPGVLAPTGLCSLQAGILACP